MESKNSLNIRKRFFESGPISITLLDLNGIIVEINSAAEKISGLKRNELIGKNFTMLPVFPSKNLEFMVEIFNELKKGEIFGPKDIQIRNKHGNIIWLNIVGSLIKFGEKFLIQVLTQDITSRKRLEQDLEKSEENYRIFTENANDLIIVVNSEYKIEYVNEKVHRKIMGYDKADLLGHKGLDLVHPEDLNKVLRALKTANKYGEGSIEARIRSKRGEYIWIEVNGKVIKDESSKVKYLLIGRDITERIKITKKLQESKDRYQNLANSLPQVIFEIDLDYNVTYTNSIASKIFGYSIEEFSKGLKIFQFLAPEDEDFVLERLNHLFEGKYTKPLVVRLRRKNGTFFYANIYGRRIFKNKKVIGARCIIHDITGMKEAEEKLKESEDKFRTIAEQSLLGICIIQDEVVKYINHVLADLLGYSVHEILNWKQGEFFKTIHPKDKKRVIELATKEDNEFENGIRYYEARGLKKNGEITSLEVYYKKITYQKKPAFLISFLDINQRKKAQEKLKDSEEKYRFLFEKSPSSILLIDTEGKIVDCNPALEKLLGYNKKELIGKKYKDLKVIASKYFPLLLERLKRVSKGKPLQPLDIELVKKDGSLIWINIESSLVKLGKKNFIIVMGHDISEKKSVEMKLKELDEMRRQFIDRASHELKTPITTIYGAFQLLNKFHKHKFDGESSDIFEMALSGTKRLKKLVDSLLDLSRLESKMFELEKSNTDLTNLIRKCINEVKYLMKSRNQTYDLELPNSLHINVDDSRIELVLTNLLTNAIKYTPISGKITIRLDNIGNSAQILVKDTGIGLTKDELNKLFKKFSKIQTPINGKLDVPLESTGLGLHIAKEIVLLHGGEIWAESEGRNKGSTFFITLPIK